VRRRIIVLTDTLKPILIETAITLKGAARRRFMAQAVKALGRGGYARAERELGWNAGTVRKGMHELVHGITCLDAFQLRGRKTTEDHLPNLLGDIRAIVDGQSQTDPQFRSNRLYTRLTAAEVRYQLIAQKGYTDAELPTERTILTKLNDLGYHPTKVAKAKPKKRSPKPTPSSTILPP
jgi:hypothetical protein